MTPLKKALAAATLVTAPLALPISHAAAQDAPSSEAEPVAPIQMRSEQVVALVNGELDVPLEEVFTEGFLQAVPPAQLTGLSAQLTSQFGRALEVETLEPDTGTRSALAIRMERAVGRGGIAIDPQDGNRINELLFRSFDPLNDSAEKIINELNALPGNVGAYFGPLDGTNPAISINPDEQFAIGSTFKIYVLAALNRRITSGKEAWDSTTDLSITRRSFPSGMMQDWPDPAPVTLQTLATMMISISDNTATDTLMRHVGVDAVIDEMIASGHSTPAKNVPFLTTREMFALKAAGDETLTQYRAASVSDKAEILHRLNDSDLDVNRIQSTFSGGPVALDVEWFASPNDLRKLYIHMLDQGSGVPLKIMSVNPSMADNGWQNWASAHYKGGSEPGVLNLTWLLYTKAGLPYVLTLSWNDADANLDETALELIAQRIMALPL
ncbi:serine hydrolase [Erythrobacter crassostreae]|uniref:Serine hydrolase n=1 Tax=Erythrobacter crassostreae TaxID=2828328 RepID=A0A9X1JLE3_9SPHN|nr:serine hydrolase [Erythrobacter crassostrea]MBV7259976.1 serine hydrolase [Erythrobacter crassostrea]